MTWPCRAAPAAVVAVILAASCAGPPTDYEREVRAVDARIAELPDPEGATGFEACLMRRDLAALWWRRAMLTGRPEDRARTREAATAGPACSCSSCAQRALLLVRLDVHEHRILEAATMLRPLEPFSDPWTVNDLWADIDAQAGYLASARARYESSVNGKGTWAALLNLAVFEHDHGDRDRAERLYVDAEDMMTSKEMRAFAWAELQRGRLESARGRQEDALRHFETANRAYSGYWLTDRLLRAERSEKGGASRLTPGNPSPFVARP